MREESELKRLKDGAWIIIWRWGVALLGLAIAALSGYAMMWLKVNAPTRSEFNRLVQTVQDLREDLIRRESQRAQLDNHERRIERLEDEERRRPPARGTP